MIHFVVPAFDEEENIPRLLEDLVPHARALEARIIVIDDGSSDGTAEAVKANRLGYPVTLARHTRNLGLGRTLDTGIRVALANASDDDAVITMEADNTSDLDILPAMLARFEEGNDLVVSSVYAPGGRLLGVGWLRVMLSRALSASFRILGRLREVHTFSSVFRVYRAGPLRRAVETYGYLLVREPGYAASVELFLKLHNAGVRITEVPTVNDWSRRRGTSKMRIRPTLLAYFRLVSAHLIGVIQPPPATPLAVDGDESARARIELLDGTESPHRSNQRGELVP